MKKIQDYINKVFKYIPKSKDKEKMIQEITQNLEDKVEDLIELGNNEEDAINKAIIEFGDAEDIKKEFLPNNNFERILKKVQNRLFFSIIGTILVIGLFLFINLYYIPDHIWFVYPVFIVLWWPLAEFFNWLNKRNK